MINLRTVQYFLFAAGTYSYENMALHRPAWQENYYFSYSWGADRAVDGLYSNRLYTGNQCTISADKKETATWRVDLQGVVSISYINIFYRTDNMPGAYIGRFAGFFLYVSNTTFKEEGFLCFHEIQKVNSTPVDDKRINCTVNGRYVIYYNERRPGVTYPAYYSQYAYNELCEVEVYGCLVPGRYGQNCNLTCSENCQEKQCDAVTGNCVNGCTPGYLGPQCNILCDQQTYGLGCSVSCGNCSDGETCHHITGTCPRGCSEGMEGEKCQTVCQLGSYGKDCSGNCSVNCGVTRRCDRLTGECVEGCQPGWRGIRCDKKCDNRTYGNGCSQSCGHCLNDTQCHEINGSCLEGCSEGHKGILCQEVCRQLYWGFNCNQTCSTDCVNRICHHESGVCQVYKSQMSDTCNTDYSITIISVVMSAVIVVSGCVFNYLTWKRNQRKAPGVNIIQQTDNSKRFSTLKIAGKAPGVNIIQQTDNSKRFSTLKIADLYSAGEMISPHYAEFGDQENPNVYEELPRYANT